MVKIQFIGLTSNDIQSVIILTQILKILNEIQLLKKVVALRGNRWESKNYISIII